MWLVKGMNSSQLKMHSCFIGVYFLDIFRLFSDVCVVCGVDGGVVKTHRLFLAGLSQFFCQAFTADGSDGKEEILVMLPDVDSSKKLLSSQFLVPAVAD